ncbi:DUF6636 domain-containing protein [Brevibacterium sp.]|uniref:DUF6636 domain-containing protein n=1 Tax=Brevibacterium sp. TaxID=1701 RepID=UPI002811E147|nr:DUF6636 domain-containing protein [Brevibacterium sp.]
MSIPPVPNHPPRPGRRKPAEESPDSITTQLFIGQDGSAAADGSTQALTPEELERLRSMVSSDGAEATEVLSLDELRELARAEGPDPADPTSEGPKVSSDDIAAAVAASAPKQWNPQSPAQSNSHGASLPYGADAGNRPQPTPQHPNPQHSPVGAYPLPAHGYSNGYAAAAPGGPGGPGGSTGPGGPAGPGGPGGYPPAGGSGGPHRREPETKKVPAWLWVLATIALVAALGIVGYIAWDSMQGRETVAGPTTGAAPSNPAPDTQDPKTSKPPQASQSFSSPSGNISCTIDPERVRCVINSYEYQPPEKPADCKLDNWGSVVVANSDSAGFSCREAPTPNGPTRVLGYGEKISAEGMTCTSTREGMVCESDSTGVGFTMRRAGVDFMNK